MQVLVYLSDRCETQPHLWTHIQVNPHLGAHTRHLGAQMRDLGAQTRRLEDPARHLLDLLLVPLRI